MKRKSCILTVLNWLIAIAAVVVSIATRKHLPADLPAFCVGELLWVVSERACEAHREDSFAWVDAAGLKTALTGRSFAPALRGTWPLALRSLKRRYQYHGDRRK